MHVTVVGVVFLLSLVVTGWASVIWVLTPCFFIAALPLPSFIQSKCFYRRVTRFMCVELLSNLSLNVIQSLVQSMGMDGSSSAAA